ncbi:MAG: hypothetical protein ACOYM0_03210 [Bacteroidales bacterium]
MSNTVLYFFKLPFLILILSLFCFSCTGSSSGVKLENQTAETHNDDSIYLPQPDIDTLVDDLSSIIAGYVPNVYKNKNIAGNDHMLYQKQVEKDWAIVLKNKIGPITSWREKNIQAEVQDTGTLFYPFAGADFLYANTFFPNCKNYILVGLEPIGKFLRCDTLPKGEMLAYLEKIRSSLYFSNNLGFFRTESMMKDLNQPTLDGTLPLIAYYVKRTHHLIRKLTYFSLDTAGLMVKCTAQLSPVGVRIDFCDSTLLINQSVYYISFDLSDKNLKKHRELLAFVRRFDHCQTFLKAASYLMFNPGFQTIRNFLLDHANVILQDDSGIPYRFFKTAKWDVRLFGSYTKTIVRFENKFQPDLLEAYEKQEKPKPVPFRIGYNVLFNETNLLLSKRKD